jgi:hypothetical protein
MQKMLVVVSGTITQHGIEWLQELLDDAIIDVESYVHREAPHPDDIAIKFIDGNYDGVIVLADKAFILFGLLGWGIKPFALEYARVDPDECEPDFQTFTCAYQFAYLLLITNFTWEAILIEPARVLSLVATEAK